MIDEKRQRRLLAFLAKGSARLQSAATKGRVLLDGGDRGVIGEEADVLASLARAELLTMTGEAVALTEVGRKAAKRAEAPADAHATQHQEREVASVVRASGAERVIVNQNESPLDLLWRRRDRNGRRFLDEREYRAGERLRKDYTYGRIIPRLGINWGSLGGASGASGQWRNGGEDLSMRALAARQRVEKAIEAVGPELAGVLIDVCCFLKGLETVEAERGWPVRSAKVVLKSALSALARHYEPETRASREARPILHWGAADYRPAIR
ncbi:DUF6456 domain-containing protein [Aminobacter sp. J44]|uniref:DUF6456 domain-containing protein n=1 Tax=Aminobacter sp. J44 TaxID=935262 RepID=UPI00119AEE4D|nr:DUF6456 domain-containing protein [Aminobacter sp. J44]TWG65289.1 hypothetical protein L610_001400000880 [Aminobacter sp. J44]